MKLSMELNAMAVTGCFCFMVKMVLDVRRLKMGMWPEERPIATMSIRGDGEIKAILVVSSRIAVRVAE
jgi:hypothetical protein